MPNTDEIFDYVMDSPENTNPAVLRSMLNSIEGGTNVVANPTLAGDEDSLTGIQIGDTKYAVGGSSGGGGVLVVHVDENDTLDKTWQEIKDASATSVVVLSMDGEEFSYLFSCAHTTMGGEKWRVGFATNGGGEIYVTTDGADSYPSLAE